MSAEPVFTPGGAITIGTSVTVWGSAIVFDATYLAHEPAGLWVSEEPEGLPGVGPQTRFFPWSGVAYVQHGHHAEEANKANDEARRAAEEANRP